jgi:hypothetical protein
MALNFRFCTKAVDQLLPATYDARQRAVAAKAANLSRQKVNRAFTQLDGIALALLC